MSDHAIAILVQGLLKLATIAAGVTCVVLGYKLFIRGVTAGGASADVGAWNARVIFGKGGPGLIFALVGLLMVAVGAFRSGEAIYTEETVKTTTPVAQSGTTGTVTVAATAGAGGASSILDASAGGQAVFTEVKRISQRTRPRFTNRVPPEGERLQASGKLVEEVIEGH